MGIWNKSSAIDRNACDFSVTETSIGVAFLHPAVQVLQLVPFRACISC